MVLVSRPTNNPNATKQIIPDVNTDSAVYIITSTRALLLIPNDRAKPIDCQRVQLASHRCFPVLEQVTE